MEKFQAQIKQLKELWPEAHEALAQNPNKWEEYVSGINLAQITECVHTIVRWMDRVKAPRGFASSFHIGRTLVAIPLDGALVNIKNIKLGYYEEISELVSNLNAAVSGIHTMVIFSRKEDSREMIASLTGELSQSICLIDTAQQELTEKVRLLEKGSEIIAKLLLSKEEGEKVLESLKQSSLKVDDIEDKLTDQFGMMGEKFSKIGKSEEELKKLSDENSKMARLLKEEMLEVETLRENNKSLTKTVEELLPKSGSAGLAYAFHERVENLEKTKWVWMGGFILSIIALACISLVYFGDISSQNHDVWTMVLNKIPLVTPLIWLGWFSAIQYGNVIRVQEDYAFKEATSKAFEGYRSHMSHLANVNFEDANNAMLHLATKTIDILSQEPLRVYSKPERDAAPLQNLMKSLTKRKMEDDEG